MNFMTLRPKKTSKLMTLAGVFGSSSWTYETSIWAKYCTPLKTDMTLENPHCQKEIHLHSWWIFIVMLVFGGKTTIPRLECFGHFGEYYLEDHPRTCKWLITMVIVSPLSRVVPLTNSLNGL